MSVHKPGKKLDRASFKSNYQEQIAKWEAVRQVHPENLSELPLFMSKGSQKILQGNFRNLGNKHSRERLALLQKNSLKKRDPHLKKRCSNSPLRPAQDLKETEKPKKKFQAFMNFLNTMTIKMEELSSPILSNRN